MGRDRDVPEPASDLGSLTMGVGGGHDHGAGDVQHAVDRVAVLVLR